MRTITFFRTVVAVALLSISTSAVFAQVTTGLTPSVIKTVTGEETDYVTVGSTIPYKVTPFDWGTLGGFMNASEFKWSVANGTGTSAAIQEAEIATSPGYFTQSQISIKWSATGTYTVKVKEKSMPKNGTGCEGAEETLPVTVLPWPTIAWGTNADPSACGLTGPIDLNLAITGSKSIKVKYTVKYYGDASSATATSTATEEKTFANTGDYNTALSAATIPVTIGAAGKYEVVITNITDKITDKSFGADEQSPNTMPVAFTFYSNPTPTTSPIQHIKNL